MKKGWQTKKLGELLEIQNGYAFSSKDYSAAGHFVMRIGNVQNGYVSLADPKFIQLPADGALQRFVLSEDDILVSLTGNVGRVGVIKKEHLPAALNQRVARISIRKDSPAIRELLLFFLFSDWFREELTGAGHGAAQQNVSTKDLVEIQIPVPPLPEQRWIVGILDEAFEGIATAKANAEKNLKNARDLFESHLQSVFTQRGKGWGETTLGREIDLLAGFAFKSAQYTNKEKDIRLLRGDNIIQGCLRWDDVKRWPANDTKEYQRYQLCEGDVVLAMDRPWVKAGLKHATIAADDLPCLLVQRTARLRGGPNLKNPFLKLLIGSSAFTSHILGVQTGIGVPHISGQQIKDFEFARPPVAEQKRIASNLESLREETQRLAALYERKLAALAALKKSLLHEAFTGQLTMDNG
jgi:type I restriction enzyme S subunit